MYRLLIVPVFIMLALAQESALERAVTLAREKRYAEAEKALQGVSEPAGMKPRIAFHRLKAAVASGLGDSSRAADEMLLALELAPQDPSLLMAAAVAEEQAGRLDDALKHVRAAGNTALAQALAGDIQEKRGEYVEAANAYKAAVALAPDSEQYRIALALELVQHQTFEPAIQVLGQAAPLFPKSARIRTLLGIAHYAMDHGKEAEMLLTDALTLDPKLEPAYGYLSRIALESAGAPPPRTLYVLCAWDAIVCQALTLRSARANGDAAAEAKAIDDLKRAPANNAVARCELGRAYETREAWAEARMQMEACARLDPSPGNHYRLGRIYSRLGLNELARKEMELRQAAAERLNAEVSRRQNAVQAFQYIMK